MSFTPRPVRRGHGAGGTSSGSPILSPGPAPGSTGSRHDRARSVSSVGASQTIEVDMTQFGVLGWKEYALLKYSNNPKFYNGAVGKELIVESAMWELQQKLTAIEAWADEVEVAAFELESNLRKEKKARLKAESNLRKLQTAIARNPPSNMSDSMLEQSRESLVRSPPRAASPLEHVQATRTLSPPRSGERGVGGVASLTLSPERSRSPLADKALGRSGGNSQSPAPHRRGSAARPRSGSPSNRRATDAGVVGSGGGGGSGGGSGGGDAGSAGKEKKAGKLSMLVSSVFGRSKNKQAAAGAGAAASGASSAASSFSSPSAAAAGASSPDGGSGSGDASPGASPAPSPTNASSSGSSIVSSFLSRHKAAAAASAAASAAAAASASASASGSASGSGLGASTEGGSSSAGTPQLSGQSELERKIAAVLGTTS